MAGTGGMGKEQPGKRSLEPIGRNLDVPEAIMITRGEQMLALRRSRTAASPPFFRGGFRPFFFGGAAWAVIALALWLVTLAGDISLPTAFAPLAWHRHEMLFGFVGAVISGFLLTAIPNWTGRLPIAGSPLAGLFALWAAARAAVLFSAVTGQTVAAGLDVGFYLLLAGLAAREVVAAKNRNLPIVGIVLLLGIANALDHAAAAELLPDPDLGVRTGIALVVMMISLIGGRIIPSFTRNWMAKQGIRDRLPTQPTRFDIAVLALTALALIGWIAMPVSVLTAAALLAAGLAQGARLARWGGLRSARDPLVFILHVGYAWIPTGLLLLAASIFGAEVPRSAAIHALTAGAMATMILAVMTRATLGHTGRELIANAPTTFLYILVTLGALLRVAAPLGLVDYRFGMEAAAVAWAGAFILFLGAYGPILFRPRAGEA
jgi:uncharacterized protein involved in response to NO